MPKPITSIYVHFLDWYHPRRAQEENYHQPKRIEVEAKHALRLALLFSDRVIIPASSFFEGSFCFKLVQEHEPFRVGGVLEVASPDGSLKEHLERKRASYDATSPSELANAYNQLKLGEFPRFVKKQQPTTPSLIKRWLEVSEERDLTTLLAAESSQQAANDLKALWKDVPHLLNRRAFVPAHISELFLKRGIVLQSQAALHEIVEPAYVASYTDEFGSSLVTELVVLEPPFKFGTSSQPSLSFAIRQRLTDLNLNVALMEAPAEAIWRISRSAEWDELAKALLNKDFAQIDALAHAVFRQLIEYVGDAHREPPAFGIPRIVTLDTSFAPLEGTTSSNSPKATIEKVPVLMSTKREVFAAIICAVEVEFIALRKVLPPAKDLDDNGREYYARIPGDSRIVVVSKLVKMGQMDAAAETTRIVLTHKPPVILLVGITGGFDAKHRYLGDLVVADQIISYEAAKVRDNRIDLRPEVFRTSSALIVQADDTARMEEWRNKVTEIRPPSEASYPRVHVASVLSGQKVVASETFMQDFRELWTTIAGVEMEGAGSALAVHRSEAQPEFLMIKGICDWADKDKQDGWQPYAADAAAAYAVTLLADLSAGTNDLPAKPAIESRDRLSPIDRMAIYKRIDADWEGIADYFEVAPAERRRFSVGREPQDLWQYLNRRKLLTALPTALLLIDRGDILETYPDLAARLENEP